MGKGATAGEVNQKICGVVGQVRTAGILGALSGQSEGDHSSPVAKAMGDRSVAERLRVTNDLHLTQRGLCPIALASGHGQDPTSLRYEGQADRPPRSRVCGMEC